ncbi:MAG: ribosome silencing factor [Candidatus Dadabacteria bacterium]|nr:MAG: ribosome silencing factor [Candidatus Dadabacteria bacterium]
MNPLELAKRAAELTADKKSADIVILDLRELSSVTDYFVICSGRSDIQVRAICDHVLERLKAAGVVPLATEGVERGRWALLDFGDVVVHVFQEATRRLFDLERLWLEAPRWTYVPGSVIESARA